MSLIRDFRSALRSLTRVKGLVITVIVTLALGIGANAAIFSVVRGCCYGRSSTAMKTV
jgi:putative ABC transport system permease protein